MQANDFDLYLLSWSMGRDNGAHIWSHRDVLASDSSEQKQSSGGVL